MIGNDLIRACAMSPLGVREALPVDSRERRLRPGLPSPHESLVPRSRLAPGARGVCVADPRDGRATAATAQDHHFSQRTRHPQGPGNRAPTTADEARERELLHCGEGHGPRHQGRPADGGARDQERNARQYRIVCEVTLMMTFDTGAVRLID